MERGDPQLSSPHFSGGSQPFSAWTAPLPHPFYPLQNSISSGNLFNRAGFTARGPLSASQIHLAAPHDQSIIFAPIQNYPDLIAGEITSEDFSDALSTIEPDVIPQEEPTYQNNNRNQERYMNGQPQATYANENPMPSYINNETVEEIRREFATKVRYPLQRSSSAQVQGGPLPPPRSRRSSARSSLASSTLSLNIYGSCASLKDCHPVHVGKDPPARPGRRRDRLRRVPQKNPELTLIPENNEETYDVPPRDSPKAVTPIREVPSTNDDELTLIIPSDEPVIPLPSTDEFPIIPSLANEPIIPLPGKPEETLIRKEEDSDQFQDAESSSSSSDKNDLSISETGEDLLKDIRSMEGTIQNMTLEVTKMIKVYDVMSFKASPTREKVSMEGPVEIEVIEGPTCSEEELVDGRTRDQINKDFRAAFFGIDDDSGNDYDFFSERNEESKEYDDIVEDRPSETDETDDDLTEIVEVSKRSRRETASPSVEDEDTLDEGSLILGSGSVSLKDEGEMDPDKLRNERYDELVYKSMKFDWDDLQEDNPHGLPPPLLLQEQIRNLKLDLLSSIFQRMYPLEEDLVSINNFIACPASLEEKYSMMRLSDILKKNKKSGIELDALAEAMSQLAQIGQELLKPEEDRHVSWRSIPVAKEITVSKGIASRAPWENIQGGTEILESLGYTEYTGYSLQYPRSVIPDLFADHIGNLTVELVLASVEISTLIVRISPNLETLILLQEAVPFPVGDEDKDYYPELELEKSETPEEVTEEIHIPPRPFSALPTMEDHIYSDPDDDDDLSIQSLPNLSPHLDLTSYPNRNPPAIQPPSHRRSMVMVEGDYEEIGPASPQLRSSALCDLCGRNPALIKCQYCSGQIFCMACDDMYHKHPKRSNHSRKALSTKPTLPPKKGISPIAPPRRNSRKSSLPDSSMTARLTRSSTLPRKGSMPLAGRPLPPPPAADLGSPLEEREYNNTLPPPLPPSLPRTNTLPRRSLPPPLITAAKPMSLTPGNPITITANNPPPPQQPILGPRTPQYPYGREAAVQIMNNSFSQNGGGSVMGQFPPETWNRHPFMENQSFTPPPPVQNHTNNPTQRRRRFNNQRINKSSSFHNIAHAEMNDQGITWEDQWLQNQGKPPSFSNFPPSNFKRALSSKSLHDGWEGNAFLPHHPMFSNPPMPGQLPGYNPQLQQPNIHRSMHELHNVGLHHPPFMGYDPRVRRSSPDPSGAGSHKSKKSDRRSNKSGGSSRRRRRSSSGRHSSSSSHRRRNHRGDKRVSSSEYSSSSASSYSSEDEDRTEDFFTGESDNDFVSVASSGGKQSSGSRITKNWVCEHCTYVNAPGNGNVCSMCCRTSAAAGGKEEEKVSSKKRSGGSKRNSRNLSEDEEEKRSSRKKEGGGKKKSDKKMNGKSKSSGNVSNISDLEEDAIQAYYALRRKGGEIECEGDGIYESNSSDAASAHNPHKTPNFDAPAPTKGILKKSSSNPQLSKRGMHDDEDFDDRRSIMTTKTDIGHLSAKLNQRLGGHFGGHSKVVDINKYLAQTQMNPNIQKSDRDFNGSTGDIWTSERNSWMQKQQQHQGGAPDYMSEVGSTATTNISQLYRSLPHNGQELYEVEDKKHEMMQEDNTNNSVNSNNNRMNSRRTSEVSSGRRNFRSKRFARERDQSLPRSDRFSQLGDAEGEDVNWDGRSGMNEGSKKGESSEEDALHFTATIQEQTDTNGPPGGIGSYLSRREFGSNDANGIPDSGYVSHSSGGGSYTKLQLPSQAPIESFTMSVDRGFLGKNPSDRDMFISMDDLSSQKAKGLELVRLLREAEAAGYTAEDIQLALNHCGESNPVIWLKENWGNMNETVVTLASNVGFEAKENTIGTISTAEATEALRKHKGNVWAAVTDCVESRQAKYDEICGKGNFNREDIITSLTVHHGNVEAAYTELNKELLKPFLMRIWGQGELGEVRSGNVPHQEEERNLIQPDVKAEFHVQLKEPEKDPKVLEFERQARKLLATESVPSLEKAEIVLHLREEFEDLSLEDALEASLPAGSLEAAKLNLKKECELCANRVTQANIIQMPSNCEHQCCKECTKNYFTLVIKDQNITEAACPFCKEPTFLNDEEREDDASSYFAKLDALLKSIVEEEVHDLFQRKLRDRTLMKDPNFKWCTKCSSGFIAPPHTKKLSCPDCKAESCVQCQSPWEPQHENISCEAFATWKRENDPESQEKGLEEHLQEYGITCPACQFRYTLTKGGCMHFVCSQCKFEFCIGCKKPFKMGVKCGKGPLCGRMGLHAHHPRNCLFYLRDKEPKDLQRLLKEHKIEYKIDPPEGISLDDGCRIPMQREKDDGGMEDGPCREEAPKGFAGYCNQHYKEYLGQLIFDASLDPLSIMVQEDLEAAVIRAGKKLPTKYGLSTEAWVERVRDMIKHEIPLEAV